MSRKFIAISISFLLIGGILVLMFNKSTTSNDNSDIGLVVYLSKKDSTEQTVLFTENDIKEFHWKKQEIIFKEKFLNEKLSEKVNESEDKEYNLGGSKILLAKYKDRFSLTLNGQEIYTGAFKQSPFSSYYQRIPYIEDIENGITINWDERKGKEDVRFNKKLYQYLKDKRIIS